MVDPLLQEIIESILEDNNEERGLKTDWKEFEGVRAITYKEAMTPRQKICK